MKIPSTLVIMVGTALLVTGCSNQETTKGSVRSGISHEPTQAVTAEPVQTNPTPIRAHFRQVASKILAWNGTAVARFQPARFEQPGRGPSAVCLDSEGRPLILNVLAKSVLQLDGDIERERVVTVTDPDFEDLTCNERSLVIFSPLRSLARILSEQGALQGEVHVPRAIRRLKSVDIRNGDIWLTTALQERWRVSRSLEPLPLAAVQRTRQEGFVLPDGKSLEVLLRESRPSLLILKTASRHDTHLSQRLVRRLLPPLRVDSLEPVWTDGRLLCLLAERRRQDANRALRVSRSLECLDLQRGEIPASLSLPAPGIYAPRRWLTMRNGVVVTMVPSAVGLKVDLWRLEVAR